MVLTSSACERGGPSSDAAARSAPVSAAVTVNEPPPLAAREVLPDGFRTPLPARERGDPAPAKRYAALSSADCRAELEARKLPVGPARASAGIEVPLRLDGPLSGVRFELPKTLYGLVDCRLVLLLDELARELVRFRVATVVVNNTYRPGAARPPKAPPPPPPKPAPKPKAKTKPARPTPAKKPAVATEPARLSQHALGLAIDITEFRLLDGTILNVERDWHGALGAAPCGPLAEVVAPHASSVLLRDLTCAVARAGLCSHLITPNRDAAHFNHLHCDIEAGAAEVSVE